jgi:hypothetical protein
MQFNALIFQKNSRAQQAHKHKKCRRTDWKTYTVPYSVKPRKLSRGVRRSRVFWVRWDSGPNFHSWSPSFRSKDKWCHSKVCIVSIGLKWVDYQLSRASSRIEPTGRRGQGMGMGGAKICGWRAHVGSWQFSTQRAFILLLPGIGSLSLRE